MLELIRQLFGQRQSDLKDLLPVLRAIIYSPVLDEVVKASPNKVDDLVLRVLRALIPAE